ncbi:MAG TPA: hypothetical protein IAB58_02575 [Candidatus Pelethosoma merdigallinarum]|nr:hypothetical protein [Candidatus Pelethosoma merdigallinarum]
MNETTKKYLENCKNKQDDYSRMVVKGYERALLEKSDSLEEKLVKVFRRAPLSDLEYIHVLLLENHFDQVYIQDFYEYEALKSGWKKKFDSKVLELIQDTHDHYLYTHFDDKKSEALLQKENDLYALLAGNQILIDEDYIHQRYFVLDTPYHYNSSDIYKKYCSLLMNLFYNPDLNEIVINPLDMVTLEQKMKEDIQEKQKGEYSSARHIELKKQYDALKKYFPKMMKPMFFNEMQYNGTYCRPLKTISFEHLCQLKIVKKENYYYLGYPVIRYFEEQPLREYFNIFNNKSLGFSKNLMVYDGVQEWLERQGWVQERYTVDEVQDMVDSFHHMLEEKKKIKK